MPPLLLDLFFLLDEWQVLEVGYALGDAEPAGTASGEVTSPEP